MRRRSHCHIGFVSGIRGHVAGWGDSPRLGSRDISAGYGYASGQAAVAHFGLGKEDAVDVEVILPHGKGRLEQRDAKSGQTLTLKR